MMLNPILARELRARSRRVGTTVTLTLFLLIMTGVCVLVWSTSSTSRSYSSDQPAAATIGNNLFEWTIVTMILVLCFVVPGFTGSAITGERDRQTLIPMQVSLLTPLRIVLGKLQSSLAYTALLLTACFPLFAVAFVVGGVTVPQVLFAILGLVLITVLLGSLSILASTLVKSSGLSTVIAYAFMLMFLVGTVLFDSLISIAGSSGFHKVFTPLNPFVMIGGLLRAGTTFSFDDGPLRSAGSGSATWGSFAYAALVPLAIWIAARRVRTPAPKDR
jgi:ABC-2 type transport system permease protein